MRAFGPEYKRWVESRLPDEAAITAARLQALATIAEHGPLSMVALSRLLGTTPHNVTKLTDGLEEDGLVARGPDDSDRRVVLLAVTAKGREAQRQLAQVHAEAVAAAFADLSDAELDQLVSLLDRLREAMRRRAE